MGECEHEPRGTSLKVHSAQHVTRGVTDAASSGREFREGTRHTTQTTYHRSGGESDDELEGRTEGREAGEEAEERRRRREDGEFEPRTPTNYIRTHPSLPRIPQHSNGIISLTSSDSDSDPCVFLPVRARARTYFRNEDSAPRPRSSPTSPPGCAVTAFVQRTPHAPATHRTHARSLRTRCPPYARPPQHSPRSRTTLVPSSGTRAPIPRTHALRLWLLCTSRPRDVRGSRSISRSRFGRGDILLSSFYPRPTSGPRRPRRVAHHAPHVLRSAQGTSITGEHDRSQQVRGGHASSSPNSARTRRRAVRHQRAMSAEGARIISTATACDHVRRSCSYLGFSTRPVSAPFAARPALVSWPTLLHAHAPHPAQRIPKASTTNGSRSETRTERCGAECRSVSFRLKRYVKLRLDP